MLIRSQDRKTLTKFDFINISPTIDRIIHDFAEDKEDESVEMIAFVGHGSNIIGAYSTEEKAIKVLDVIQEEYEKANTYYCDGYVSNVIFQMPQDDNV